MYNRPSTLTEGEVPNGEAPTTSAEAEVPAAPPTKIQVTTPAGTRVLTLDKVATRTHLMPPAEPPGEVCAGTRVPTTTDAPPGVGFLNHEAKAHAKAPGEGRAEAHTGVGVPANEAKTPATPMEAEVPTIPAEIETTSLL